MNDDPDLEIERDDEQQRRSKRLWDELVSRGMPEQATFFAPHGLLNLRGRVRGGRTPCALIQWRSVDGDHVYLEVGWQWKEGAVERCERERYFVPGEFVRHAVDRANWFCLFGSLGNAEHLRPYREATDLFIAPPGPPT